MKMRAAPLPDDLTKIDYAGNEAYRYQHQSDYATRVTLAALKHTMGMPSSAPLVIAEKRLPKIKNHPKLELARLFMEAAENRPEWSQLDHGEKAALAWKDAEALSNMPTLFLAGTIEIIGRPCEMTRLTPTTTTRQRTDRRWLWA